MNTVPVEQIEEVYDALVRAGANPHKRNTFINDIKSNSIANVRIKNTPAEVTVSPDDWSAVLRASSCAKDELRKHYSHLQEVNRTLEMIYSKFN